MKKSKKWKTEGTGNTFAEIGVLEGSMRLNSTGNDQQKSIDDQGGTTDHGKLDNEVTLRSRKHLWAVSTRNRPCHLRVLGKIVCRRTKPSGQKKRSCEKEAKDSKVKAGSQQCSLRSQVRTQGRIRTARWRWMVKLTVVKTAPSNKGDYEGVA